MGAYVKDILASWWDSNPSPRCVKVEVVFRAPEPSERRVIVEVYARWGRAGRGYDVFGSTKVEGRVDSEVRGDIYGRGWGEFGGY